MGIEIENFILEKLGEYGSLEYDELIDMVQEYYCANHQTINDSIHWLYCQGKLEIRKPNVSLPFYESLGELTLKTDPLES